MIVLRNLLSIGIKAAYPKQLLKIPIQSFAFMSLFQNPKKKQQLHPVFKHQIHVKGHIRSQARKGVVSNKLNHTVKVRQLKRRNHRGMIKRVKIVGPRWNRQFKFRSPHRHHLRRNKSSQNLDRKKRDRHIHKHDLWRVKRLIPYFKRKKLKNLY